MSVKPKPRPVDDEAEQDAEDSAMDMALISLTALAIVNGMWVFNSFKKGTIGDYGGEVVEWTTHPEMTVEGPCVYCDDMDGEQFDIDETPDLPAHVNCTCSWESVSEEDIEDTMSLDDFTNYQAWRDSSRKALDKLLKTWTKGDASETDKDFEIHKES